ncbi:unnamed protein product [Linum tenue]|uniref:Crossover junction endonuclease MUS81 n=1 Tax=Linum tenue TaxID=586396 RepID=A0AAV0RUW3_9ROSI|nr:unnamed protein product [Linum tenue]
MLEMENRKRVVCPGNEDLVSCLLQKRRELADSPKGLSDNLDMTLSKAYNSVCCAKTPIKTLKEFSQLKGVGTWMVKLMKGFFNSDSGSPEPEDLTGKGKKANAKRRYMPQKNSVAYALLISLYRGTTNGKDFMHKQELIDAAEASGLSRAPIAPEKGKGKAAHLGSSPRDFYSGWSCMKTLITKGLVVKSSCPAKYKLTQEGREVARECMVRSCLLDPKETVADAEDSANLGIDNAADKESIQATSSAEVTIPSVDLNRQERSINVPTQSLERFLHMGYSKEQVFDAFIEVSKTSGRKDISSLWPAVLCHLREEHIYGFHSDSQTLGNDCQAESTNPTYNHGQVVSCGSRNSKMDWGHSNKLNACSIAFSLNLKACSSNDYTMKSSSSDNTEQNMSVLSMPPLGVGERFEDVYEVLLILDDREQFATQGTRGRKLIDGMCNEHGIKVEVRRLPVGDGIWLARHKYHFDEYVLDFVVERKNVDDLRSSIRDNRYRDQKLRLQRCGLKKLMYLVEGDPNCCDGAESIKTACFTTEILEGFDVQRTTSLPDTLKKYSYLTKSVSQYYRSQRTCDRSNQFATCPRFCDFIKRCEELDKMTVGDVFAIQLMQVPQVTEQVAMAVLDLYPTLLSLACAYSLLEGDFHAQVDMLRKQSNDIVSPAASRNIFHLVWGQ